MNALRATSIALIAAVVASYVGGFPTALTVGLTAGLVVTTGIDAATFLRRRPR
ncbi:MAG: hypothetical protein ACK4UY_03765 [Dietzia sp.]